MSAAVRHLWTAAGLLSVAIGAIGAVVPLLPTVPFMLLAVFCFARGSARLHGWLVSHPRFGPAIAAWQAHGAISRPAKRAAVLAIALSFGVSLALGVPASVLAIQAVVLAGVLVFLLTRPSVPPGREGRPEC